MSFLITGSPTIEFDYPFDPTYGYTPESMLALRVTAPPTDFEEFWRSNYTEFLKSFKLLDISDTGKQFNEMKIKEITFQVHDQHKTGAWLLEPTNASKGLVVGHGYGGRQSYNTSFLLPNTAIIMPCALGFNLSKHPDLPNISSEHVIFNIENKNKYIIKYNVMEMWASAKILKDLYGTEEIYYDGSSFGGGLGALAIPWEPLFKKAHLSVPTFGNQELRLKLNCKGSGQSVKTYYEKNDHILEKTLRYFDSAVAAKFGTIPTLFSLAAFDPSVPPPGQFSVYNEWTGPKQAIYFHSGHHSTEVSTQEDIALLDLKHSFFAN